MPSLVRRDSTNCVAETKLDLKKQKPISNCVCRRRWAETHEVIHSVTEWHQLFLFGDSSRELNPACHDQLKAEANFGAGQLLFMRGRFVQEAHDMEMSLATIKALSTRFGNTMTSTLWRYVEQLGVEKPMVGLVTVHPHWLPDDHDVSAPCKYFIESPAFRVQFSSVAEVEVFDALQQYCSRAKGGPLGSAEVILRDVNGTAHVFWFETFSNRYADATKLGGEGRNRAPSAMNDR